MYPKTITAIAFLLIWSSMTLSSRRVLTETGCSYSSLWGRNGEKWSASGRLPDFSYSGYHAGEAKIPARPAKWNLKRDFHAVGDGHADDTNALITALQTIPNGVLFIPEGTYLISKRIDIVKGNVVIRGAGQKRTVLLFPNSLQDLFGNTARGTQQSQWSFRPGLINVTGQDLINDQTRLARVVGGAKRGDRTLRLSKPISVKKEEWIRLAESDPPKAQADTGSLIKFLYGNLMPAGTDLLGTPNVIRFLSRVKAVRGSTVELERPLPYDVRLEWSPEIHRFSPSVTEVGVEHLSIKFPWSPYPGHFKEKGYNGLFFQSVSNCWVNDVEIQNSDFGVDFNATNFCTISNVTLTTSAPRDVVPDSRGANGHHGIDVSHGTENLVTDFDVKTKLVHDISVEWYALHTVFANGRGLDLNMDHHREANYSTLFSNIDCGKGTRPFNSGGSSDRGAHSGAYSTYWNIRATGELLLPPKDFGPLLNFVGISLKAVDQPSPYDWFLENQRICTAELHAAMKKKRLRGS